MCRQETTHSLTQSRVSGWNQKDECSMSGTKVFPRFSKEAASLIHIQLTIWAQQLLAGDAGWWSWQVLHGSRLQLWKLAVVPLSADVGGRRHCHQPVVDYVHIADTTQLHRWVTSALAVCIGLNESLRVAHSLPLQLKVCTVLLATTEFTNWSILKPNMGQLLSAESECSPKVPNCPLSAPKPKPKPKPKFGPPLVQLSQYIDNWTPNKGDRIGGAEPSAYLPGVTSGYSHYMSIIWYHERLVRCWT